MVCIQFHFLVVIFPLKAFQWLFLFLCLGFAGSRFQAARYKDEEEDVVSEHEDKADCLGHHHCINPHHNLVRLPWLQMLI